MLDNSKFDSPEALAALSVNVSCVRHFLRRTIMAGKVPCTRSLTKLDTNLPFSWQEQLKLFGLA